MLQVGFARLHVLSASHTRVTMADRVYPSLQENVASDKYDFSPPAYVTVPSANASTSPHSVKKIKPVYESLLRIVLCKQQRLR